MMRVTDYMVNGDCKIIPIQMRGFRTESIGKLHQRIRIAAKLKDTMKHVEVDMEAMLFAELLQPFLWLFLKIKLGRNVTGWNNVSRATLGIWNVYMKIKDMKEHEAVHAGQGTQGLLFQQIRITRSLRVHAHPQGEQFVKSYGLDNVYGLTVTMKEIVEWVFKFAVEVYGIFEATGNEIRGKFSVANPTDVIWANVLDHLGAEDLGNLSAASEGEHGLASLHLYDKQRDFLRETLDMIDNVLTAAKDLERNRRGHVKYLHDLWAVKRNVRMVTSDTYLSYLRDTHPGHKFHPPKRDMTGVAAKLGAVAKVTDHLRR